LLTGNKKILVVGGGGREHAITNSLARSSLVSDVFVSPGNCGTGKLLSHYVAERGLNKCWNVPIAYSDGNKLIEFAKEQGVDLVVIGPEQPLVDGFSDTCRREVSFFS
jgi:phosphoribosylamine-glycine ligase